MPEDEKKILTEAFSLYEKYRSIEMKVEDWVNFANNLAFFEVKWHWEENPLAKHIGAAIIEALGDMYRDGKKPAIPDYFGRDDL